MAPSYERRAPTNAAAAPRKTVAAPRPTGLAHGRCEPILLVFKLPDGNGLELLDEIHQLHPRLPVVVLSRSEPSGEQLSLVDAALGESRMDTQHLLTILARLLPAKESSNA